MSIQKSIKSFFTKTPTTVKESTQEGEVTFVEKHSSNGSTHANGTLESEKKAMNGKEIVTSTPKRKNPESLTRGKKAKSSPVKKRKRIEIQDDDVNEEGANQTIGHNGTENGTPVSSLLATSEISFRSSSFLNDSSMLQESMEAGEGNGPEHTQEADFEHTRLPFLQPENITDLNGRRPSDEDYDPSTLFVPPSYSKDLTPALRKWWEFKAENYDKILLFKVGKFYELYHMDAVIAVQLLNLAYMKGAGSEKRGPWAHCGFPEIAFGRFADQLVQSGYKVARIEQTETTDAMDKRLEKTPGKKLDRLVRREICRVITPGTKTYSYLEGDDCQTGIRVLLALCESFKDNSRRYGLCFVDCSVGNVWVSEFDDDYHCSRLRTLLAQYPPAEVLFPKKRISAATELLLSGLISCKLQPLAWKSEFPEACNALKWVSAKRYFVTDGDNTSSTIENLPPILREAVDEADVLGTKCKQDHELSISAFGAIVGYLHDCMIDYDIFPMKLFEKYEPPGVDEQRDGVTAASILPALTGKMMVLDSAALKNLDVLESSSKLNQIDGTLLELLDTCCTPFGKRLLRYWLCNPLCDVGAIKERQEAIAALLALPEFMRNASEILQQMPDLERQLQRVHSMGTKKRLNHPDSRAVLFEADKYNKRKVNAFLSTLDGLHKACYIANEFKAFSKDVDSDLLQRCLLIQDDGENRGRLPNLKKLLKEIESKFDRERAQKEAIVVITEDVAEIKQKIENIEAEFEEYLKTQRKKFSSSSIRYAQTTGKNRYMLEIPEATASRVSSEFTQTGQIKGFRRFLTPELQKKLKLLEEAEAQQETAFGDSMRRIFEMFSDRGNQWRRAVDRMAILDVLLALARYVQNSDHPMCVPAVENATKGLKPFIEVVNGYHPCSAKIFTTLGQFVPNDTILGKGNFGSILLLTGPNMGGKSTLMRQVASLVILAQIGSYVPARSMSLTVVDRIFTRLGASDRLSAGQSTFAVELTETNMILRHATVHSLVIIDELGRGTATHDGAAIAYAVLKQLAEGKMGPRTLFSTHYHSLVTRLSGYGNITLGHMSCVVENDNDVDDPSEETITFLYKLAGGACPKSYGFHAAKLSGISKEIVASAYAKAHEIDHMLAMARHLRDLANDCQTMSDDVLIAAAGSLSIVEPN